MTILDEPGAGLYDDEASPPWELDQRPVFKDDALGIERPQEPEPTAADPRPWLFTGRALLGEPDPGPTPWLVDDLIVDQALIAAVGRWKTTKSYGLLEIAVSIATGRPAFGTHEIPNPGPVVFVIEESGKAALWRRLDALARGRAIPREELADLHLAANARVKLDRVDWQTNLLELGKEIKPRLFIFDPLARMKAPARKENEQSDMAVLIEFIRQLRDDTGAAVAFVQHQGHQGDNMRGSSDLESMWETRLTWTKDGDAVTVKGEHREAEESTPVHYSIRWDEQTRTIRLAATDTLKPTGDRIFAWLENNGAASAEKIARELNTRDSDVRRTLAWLVQAGTLHVGPSGRRDKAGRAIRDKVYNTAPALGMWPGPDHGTTHNSQGDESVGRPDSLSLIGDGPRHEAPAEELGL